MRAAGRLDHPASWRCSTGARTTSASPRVGARRGGPFCSRCCAPQRPADATRSCGSGEDAVGAGHAHARGVVHRDVKPREHPDRARRAAPGLSDFGVARLSGETGLTMTGSRGRHGGLHGAGAGARRARGAGGPTSTRRAWSLYEGLTGSNPSRPLARPSHRAAGRPRRRLPPLVPRAARSFRPPVPRGRRRPAPRSRRPCRAPSGLADELSGCSRRRARGPARAGSVPAVASAVGGARWPRWPSRRRRPIGRVGAADWTHAPATAPSIGLAALAFAWRPARRPCWRACRSGGAGGPGAPRRRDRARRARPRDAGDRLAHGRLTCSRRRSAALRPRARPLSAALAGLVPRWRDRLWVATAGVVATLAWQVGAGTDGLMAGGGYVRARRRDPRRRGVAARWPRRRLWQPLAAHPRRVLQAPAIVVGAMCVPLVLRAPPGRPRAVAAAALGRCSWRARWWRVADGAVAPRRRGPGRAGGRGLGAPALARACGGAPPARASATLRGPTA